MARDQRVTKEAAQQAAELAAKQASDHEETRFTKKQQWAVTAAGLGIMLALYSPAQSIKSLSPNEDLFISALILITPLLCIYFLWDLQCHLSEVRQRLDPDDKEAFLRGLDILAIFASVLIIGAFLFLYALHRGP